MSSAPESAISHISLGTADLERAKRFYDAVLAPLGIHRIMEKHGGVAYGRSFPEFWLQRPLDGQPPTVGNGTHIAFLATSEEQVRAFYEAAIAAGGLDAGGPGPRPEYSPAYHGAFVRDPDGHKIEATFFDMAKVGG